MIINNRYKFVFLKTSKTAGTSMEIAFSGLCDGPDDIVTPISDEDEQIRERYGSAGPKNCFSPPNTYRGRDVLRLLAHRKRKLNFYNHMTAAEVKMRVPPTLWSGYFKFCFERNPWDRAVSHYFHINKKRQRSRSFSEYIFSDAIFSLKRRGHDVYTIDNSVVVDRVCKYENLEGELERIQEILGVKGGLPLPNAKGAARKDRRPYQDFYGRAERNRVAAIFEREIEMMGYHF